MKYLTLTLLAFIICTHCISQSDNHNFGKVDKQELLMKNCDFDNNASALTLFDIGQFYCDIRYTQFNQLFIQTERHVRIKILNNKGLEKANIHIRFYSNSEVVKDLVAQTYNLDAAGNVVVTKFDKKNLFTKKLNKHLSEVAFSFPEVKAGSVIEYKYNVDGGEENMWYFQKSIPVLFSQFTIDFPYELEMQCMPICTLPYHTKKDDKGSRFVQTFSMEKIPSLNDEAYISCDEDYLQRLDVRLVAFNFPGSPRKLLTRSWPGIVKDLMEDDDFGVQLKKDIPRTEDLNFQLKNIKDPYQKMTTIHDYVRRNMKWNEYDNIWALEGVKSAWKDKKGTSGEINLILVNLLKSAGLNANPVLLSTRQHGMINVFTPRTSEFDKVMAYVTIDDQHYVLDATEKFTPSYLIPKDVLGGEGLVIEKYETFEWGWKTLWDDKEVFKNVILLDADVDSTGLMKGTASITSFDHARVERCEKLAGGKDELVKAFFSGNPQGLKIDSINFENEKNDSLPLVQNIQFTQPLNSSGEYQFFTANLFSGLEKNPFLADNRFSDIFFGYNQQIMIAGNFRLPSNYSFEELPKNIKMIMPDTGIVFTRMAGVNENTLSLRITVDFRKPVYLVAEYDEFKEFYKKLFNFLNEQFVIKKKS